MIKVHFSARLKVVLQDLCHFSMPVYASIWIVTLVFLSPVATSQVMPGEGDPPNNSDIPAFFKSKLSDIEWEVNHITKGQVKVVSRTPGGLPVYAIYYGSKDDLHSQANYNSALGAGSPAWYAEKDSSTKPVIFFLGPVHGQEVEGIAGLVNLVHVIETGRDYRGKDWTSLQKKIQQCRVIIVPCANPDGRRRCPYDSFLGLPTLIMTKYGQGTRKDGSLWGWPLAKSVHPMKGDVGILGSYFNDNGVNMMHDDFFSPMAQETKAIMEIARSEAPDMTVSLHSHEYPPVILQPDYEPFFMKERVYELALQLNNRYKVLDLPHDDDKNIVAPGVEDKDFPPRKPFNLVSALHQVSGTMSFTFECPHGSLTKNLPMPPITYDDLLDIQLILYDEMLDYLMENRLYWLRKE